MNIPIRVHPDNPKCFEFRGKPRVLVTATEHYGAVMNRPFRYERYLADAAEKGMTLTRLFVLFRELQLALNPYSTCKPESPDYVAPFLRTGPSAALDGQPKYDLNRWNPEFFERLHGFLSLASDYGIIVEITLLSNTYSETIWALNPFNNENNINGLEKIAYPEYMSLRHRDLFERQADHVRQIVQETNRYDNIFYEICNEPGGKEEAKPENPTPEEVDKWQMAIAEVIRGAELELPNKHLIAGGEAFTYIPWEMPTMKSFRNFKIDVVNLHPVNNMIYDNRSYDMGYFMSKQLRLRALRNFCLATYHEPKPLNLDEDNVASMFKDQDGWTIHRKRAWTALFSGAHYDYIDFSIINYCETGTEDSQRCIRVWMKHLSEFIHTVDLVHARPFTSFLRNQPPRTLESVFGVEGKDYCIYLADERELEEAGCGEPISGELKLDLPTGFYDLSCYSPVTGLYSPKIQLAGGTEIEFKIPEFRHDLVVRIRQKIDGKKL